MSDLCCKCYCYAELFDVLTASNFCCWCYGKALEGDHIFRAYGHVKERLYERYEIRLTISKYQSVIAQIEDPEVATNLDGILKVKGVDVSGHLITLGGKNVIVIYRILNSYVTGCLITALPIQKILRRAKQCSKKFDKSQHYDTK